MHQQLMAILKRAPVMPVLVIEDAEHAVPLATALRDGGLPVLEITLRTRAALNAIDRIREEVDGVCVGAGTVLNAHDVKLALAARSEFLVTPGSNSALLDAGMETGLPFLPGIATASEALACMDRGLRAVKFFPAEAMGGLATLKALSAPLADLQFCPTGGVKPENALQYLALPSVITVGGSWIAPLELQRAGDWEGIRQRAAIASQLRATAGG
ncbi:bifunctional 4-hydroxy-2-oxoglutarate aldolase/2-dehydro-3-deoxy-phosphogluconate aldolase [Spongiibacter sp.]|uniref:bifunctional 4-hydroxy-2-oxoglutarate aldolase/2-dehydro-3-deoxy-phosphogluconate aldolase n=1 Tax=Spongiibacter sp. TaxID=2024860 RepID=UPI000C4BDD4D|nr:bifunctional 4-hydroxy-2-oxoglutarate aldolase/2-dehydro-3-deoxy-phosphogluconate aldolase [Spongiibacter sp.]MBU72942.1 keto-deoxy-phosphogluconate aldolase [Spongiibacter sp.]